MKLRPTIFLSGVSSEFRSFRDAVEIEVQKKGCFPSNQSSFEPDYRTVEEMLRRRLSEADAVIHIAGFRFGAEPNERPADKRRRSYTQLEYDIAHEMEKPVYVFLSADAGVRDVPGSDEKLEDAEVAALQLAHRQSIQNRDRLYDFFKDKAELCQKVAQIPIVASTDFRVDISRIDKYAPAELIGREDELKLLNDAWLKVRRAESQRAHIITFVALGGEGKTSLVAKWLAELAHQGWPGCDTAFAWSFYSQGTRDQVAASSDLFLKEAITFFGNEQDKEFAAGNAGAYEKGQRLARIVARRRSLLILDGVEPLQHAPASPTPSEIKDSGLAALLKGLAADNNGLCLVTTRYSVPDLKAFWRTTGQEVVLFRLSKDAGVHLLKTLGVRGTTKEFETLVEDVKGHALTLNLLGTYLRDAHWGDIRRRDLVKLEEADAEEQGGHAFRVIEAYEQAFEDRGEKGNRALAVLRLIGLFDRPVSADCLTALLEKPFIVGLSEPLVELSESQRNLVFRRLEDAKLITLNCGASGALVSLDAHPLMREYFARQLCTQRLEAWRTAHRRVYEHLCATTTDRDKPTLEDLQPLYQAVAHGCHAGLQKEALTSVCVQRIWRGEHTIKNLGAFASDLGVISCFFEQLWSQLKHGLAKSDHAFLRYNAAFCLRALGRLTESVALMRASRQVDTGTEVLINEAIRLSNLSEVETTLGNLNHAIKDAKESVSCADRSLDRFQRMARLSTYGAVLHQSGRWIEAKRRFREAERIQVKRQPHYPLLYSLPGYQYCELLLGNAERAAWRKVLRLKNGEQSLDSKVLQVVYRRGTLIQAWAAKSQEGSLITLALQSLILARVSLYKAILVRVAFDVKKSDLKNSISWSVDRLRHAAMLDRVPLGLLTSAWVRFLIGPRTGLLSAQENLDEAWEIAERGPMRLHMADIHLYRARLFFREEKYPWGSAREDLEAAEKLINECGYHRRDEELADAKRAILGQSA